MLFVPYLASLIRVVLEGTPFPNLERATPLLLGVAAQESGLHHTRQLGNGPARGYWQMEGQTEKDHMAWVQAHQPFADIIQARCGVAKASVLALEHNLPYQILMARLHFYVRDPQALPQADDLQGQAKVWKQYYNTAAGHGTVAQYRASWARLIAPHWPEGAGTALAVPAPPTVPVK